MEISLHNSKGELDFRYEDVVSKYMAQVGRYLKMDNSPVATKRGESLGSLRNAGIANALLQSLAARLPLNRIKTQVIVPFLKYGTVGITHIETGNKQMPDELGIVSPRQLRGFPAWTDGLENLYGQARKRWVPLAWAIKRVKEVYGKTLTGKDAENRFGARDVPWGTTPPEQSEQEQGVSWGMPWRNKGDGRSVGESVGGPERNSSTIRKEGRYFVPLEEIYIFDDTQMYVARFIVKIGDTIVHDSDFESQNIQVLCPLQVARHTDIGKYFARGFVSPLMPLNDQIEKSLGTLFKNIQELDMFGTLFVPGQSGIDLKKWRTGPRPKVESYNIDPVDPGQRPFVLQPANGGTAPAKIAEFAMGQMEKQAGQGPIFQGQTSGRVDSAAGLGFLFNTANIAIGLPANGLADAYAGVYSRMLQAAKDRMGPGDTIEIAMVDDAIAGVVVDQESGSLRLAENPIPESWQVDIDVRDRTPRDRDVRKQELITMYDRKLTDDTHFWITAFEENLDFPGAPKEIWETWRKAIWQIIMLFRDGQTPGNIDVGEHTQNPDIHLIAVQRFMSKIEYSLASKEVRDKFESWKVSLEILAGSYYPPGLPPPEQLIQGVQAGQPTGMAMPPQGAGG